MTASTTPQSNLVEVNRECLRRWPLPQPDDDGDKEERGRVLIIAGSREMPGAVILAANAALHAGAGKLTVATAASVAKLIALALPEARVIELPETESGGVAEGAIACVRDVFSRVDAVLIGPGMQDETTVCSFCEQAMLYLSMPVLVLDAAALGVVRQSPKVPFPGPTILTPHAGELAHLTGCSKDEITTQPAELAAGAARQWNAVVALKGAATFIAAPSGSLWRHEGGNVGLAISGSGDVLAGIVAGLASRGAPAEQAAVWGVALHALAGEALASRTGPLGYLARDLSAELPALMHKIAQFSDALG